MIPGIPQTIVLYDIFLWRTGVNGKHSVYTVELNKFGISTVTGI